MNIYEKLFKIRKDIRSIPKDGSNPYFDSEYITNNGLIDALDPFFEQYNLMVTQPTTSPTHTGYVAIKTHIKNLDDPFDEIEFLTELPVSKNDPQAGGSVITYSRRYALISFLRLKAEDDDGNIATMPDKATTRQVEEINTLTKKLGKQQGLSIVLKQAGVTRVEDLPKNKATVVINRLKELENGE